MNCKCWYEALSEELFCPPPLFLCAILTGSSLCCGCAGRHMLHVEVFHISAVVFQRPCTVTHRFPFHQEPVSCGGAVVVVVVVVVVVGGVA